MGAVGVVAFGLVAAAAPVAFQRDVAVRSPAVALGDLADLSRLPAALRGRAAALPIARVPAQGRLVLTSQRLAERARALMPALGPWLAPGTDDAVVVRLAAEAPAPAAKSAPPAGCQRVAHPVAAGAIPTVDDLAPATCEAGPAGEAFRYDPAAKAVRATRDLAPGETVAAVPRFAIAGVRPGQRLFLKTRVGPVVVEREVEALQPARPGGQLFVRSLDGAIFPARFAEAGQ